MLIGLHGKAGSGKDTAYSMIRDEFERPGCRVVRDAFADRLKLSAARLFYPGIGLEDAVAWCNSLKQDDESIVRRGWMQPFPIRDYRTVGLKEFMSGREFLQRYGTEAHRDVFGADFWVDAVLPDWQDDDYGRGDGLTANDILVITDVRFENEAERVLECGGSLWHIMRPSAEVGDAHASEQVLPAEYFTTTIENLTSLEALCTKVVVALYNDLAVRQG